MAAFAKPFDMLNMKHNIGTGVSSWVIWQYGLLGQMMFFPLVYPTGEGNGDHEIFPLDLVWYAIMTAVIGNICNWFYNKAVTIYKLGKIVVLLYLIIIFNLMWDILFFDYDPTGYTIYGSVLIIISSIICFLQQESNKKSE